MRQLPWEGSGTLREGHVTPGLQGWPGSPCGRTEAHIVYSFVQLHAIAAVRCFRVTGLRAAAIHTARAMAPGRALRAAVARLPAITAREMRVRATRHAAAHESWAAPRFRSVPIYLAHPTLPPPSW